MFLINRKILLLLICSCFSIFRLHAQDFHFSQFYAHPVYLNPAFSGTLNCPRIGIQFRDQWPAIKNNFISFSVSYDQYIKELHGGIGMLVNADIAMGGIFQTYNADIIYNYRVHVSPKFNLNFALQPGIRIQQLNWDQLKFASTLLDDTPELNIPLETELKKTQLDLSFGVVGYSNYIYFGLAAHHLLPLQSSYYRPHRDTVEKKCSPKFTLHFGANILVKQKIRNETNVGDVSFLPNVIFISQGPFNYLHEGFYFNIYPLTVGAWLRHTLKKIENEFKSRDNFDALIFTIGLEYKMVKIGYSYDFTLSRLEKSGGAHEVSLQFVIPCDLHGKNTKGKKPKRSSTRYPYSQEIKCPGF